MNAFQQDPKTGFLESNNPSSGYLFFKAHQKSVAIQLATDAVKRKELPSISDICEAIGINERTFYRHLKDDHAFAEAWQEVKVKIDSTFGKEVAIKALKPNGTLALLALLRKNETGSWSGEYRLNQSTDMSGLKGISTQFPEIIDAEIVPEKENK